MFYEYHKVVQFDNAATLSCETRHLDLRKKSFYVKLIILFFNSLYLVQKWYQLLHLQTILIQIRNAAKNRPTSTTPNKIIPLAFCLIDYRGVASPSAMMTSSITRASDDTLFIRPFKSSAVEVISKQRITSVHPPPK